MRMNYARALVGLKIRSKSSVPACNVWTPSHPLKQSIYGIPGCITALAQQQIMRFVGGAGTQTLIMV